jgi:hypothetical protein
MNILKKHMHVFYISFLHVSIFLLLNYEKNFYFLYLKKMLSKLESNEINNKKQKNKSKLKKFNKNNLSKLLENNDQEDDHTINSDTIQSDDQDFDSYLDEKLTKDQIDYYMKKPGPHAKAGEWRKWKMMRMS